MSTLKIILDMGFFPVCGLVIALLICCGGTFYGFSMFDAELDHYLKTYEMDRAAFATGIFIFLFVGFVIPVLIVVPILVCCLGK